MTLSEALTRRYGYVEAVRSLLTLQLLILYYAAEGHHPKGREFEAEFGISRGRYSRHRSNLREVLPGGDLDGFVERAVVQAEGFLSARKLGTVAVA
jgi:hypothetical protein